MIVSDMSYSRPAATAERLGEVAGDRHRFLDKRVLLTGESNVLATANGRSCFLDSLRLLVRICRNIDISIPGTAQSVRADARLVVDQIAFGQNVAWADNVRDFSDYDAILSVGVVARPDLPWTVINAHGWLARVSSGSTDLLSACDQYNPITALAAASLGVAEVFKRLLHLKPVRGELTDSLIISLETYEVGEQHPGASLPLQIDANLVVAGAGAIGNAMVHLLSQLPLTGHVAIVDRQVFGEENLGTCLLLGPALVGTSKAAFAADVLTTAGIRATGFTEDISTFAACLGVEVPYPPVVLAGLDNIAARHAAQDLWPDLVIDGAISDFGCQVSRHPWDEDVACLRCLFREPVGDAAERIASRATGLGAARTREAKDLLAEADVLTAPAEKQAWLRERVGRPICSVVGEATTRLLSEEQQRHGFEPSVPFVASLSASMAVGEFVKWASGMGTPLEPRYQLDVLRGPRFGELFPQVRRTDCTCVSRRHNIDKLRQMRIAT